jgi:hypothetical protein
MSAAPHDETVDEMTAGGDSFATPNSNPKPKVKAPASAPGRTKRSSKTATTSAAPHVETVDEMTTEGGSFATPNGDPKPKVKVAASAPGRTKRSSKTAKQRTSSPGPIQSSDKEGKMKKTKSKKNTPVGEDNWSVSSEEENSKANDLRDFNEFSQSLPGPPLTKKSNSTKKGLREEKLARKGSSRTSATNNGDTLTPILKKKAFTLQGGSNVSNTSPRRRQSTPAPATPDGLRSVTPPRSPMTPKRHTVAGVPRMTTPRAASSRFPMRSSPRGVGLSPQGRSMSQQLGGPPFSNLPRRAQSLMSNSPGAGLPVVPLTPRSGRRSLPVPRSPGSLAASERYSLAASSTRILTPRTPKSPARRSVLGGRRATIGLDDVKKLEIGPLDDDVKKGAGSDGSSPGDEKEALLVKRTPYPKTDEEWEAFDTPPKSLVLVWVVVMGELVFDMGTTMIAFRALGAESDCCGYPITVGAFPMLFTAPFFLLVSSEIALLLRAIMLTMCLT